MRGFYVVCLMIAALALSSNAEAMTLRQSLDSSNNGCSNHFQMDCTRCHGETLRTADGSINLTETVNQVCVECHKEGVADQEMASVQIVNSRGQVKKIVFNHQLSHPTDINYAKHAMTNKRMRPVDRLDDKIRLINGEVGCLSCHNPASPEPAFLIGSYADGNFCRQCHQNY